MPTSQQINTGLYVPTTEIFDVISGLQQSDVSSGEFKELLIRLAQHVNRVNLALNLKESALYFEEEFMTGDLLFNPLNTNPDAQIQMFRKVLRESSDPHKMPTPEADVLQAGSTNFPHVLTPLASTSSTYTGWKFVGIYGGATNTVSRNYYPLNYSGATYLSARADSTNVIIDNNTGITFDKVDIILWYVKF